MGPFPAFMSNTSKTRAMNANIVKLHVNEQNSRVQLSIMAGRNVKNVPGITSAFSLTVHALQLPNAWNNKKLM